MYRRAFRKTVAAPACLAAAFLFSAPGCGGGAGHVKSPAEAKPPSSAVAGWWQTGTLKPGTRVKVRLRNGTSWKGKLRGLEARPPADYASAYERARQALQGEATLPSLGQNALVRSRRGGDTRCELLGFDPRSVIVTGLEPPRRFSMSVDDVVSVADSEGRAVTGPVLDSLMQSGRVPFSRALHVEVDGGAVMVPTEDVSWVERQSGPGAVTGAVLLVGVAVLIGVASSGSDPEPPPQGSCPLVYSFDGRRYVRDAEPLSGAAMEVAQRSDASVLAHLRESAGLFRLRVANELPETDYLDEIKLVVVDHPRGGRVMPDLYGRLHALAHPLPPSSVTDLQGADLRDLVSSEDGSAWPGRLFGRDPADPEQPRQGLVAEFPRPAGATRALLAVRAQGTPLGPRLVHDLLGLQGRDLDSWYERVAADPALQQQLERLQMEMVPVVRLWTGGRWKAVDLLSAALPTLVPGSQAVPLDLRGVEGDVVRVRIDGLPGFFTVDGLGLDFTAEAPLPTRELSARSARTTRGEDVRASLLSVDRIRHRMETGDAVELTFVAPAAVAGSERTVVVRSTGYYRLRLAGRGDPQTAAFDRLSSEPSGLGRYVAHWVSADVSALVASMR